MAPLNKTIGFIGLGIMGEAMAKNTQKAGFSVWATSRSESKRTKAIAEGLNVLPSPKEVAEKSEVIVTMVTDPAAVQQVMNGVDGVFKTTVKGKTLIQMSTLDIESTKKLGAECLEKEMAFLDCPVTGSKIQVEQAQLILLAGGEASLIEELKDLLLAMGKAIVYAGEVGKGTALKLCMNLIVAQMTTALCESIALANVCEVEPKKIFEVISHSPALNCGYFKIKENVLLSEDFSPAFSLANMLKDVRFMTDEAKRRRVPLPVTQAVRFLMEGAMQEGLGDLDLTSISKILRPKSKPATADKEAVTWDK